MEKNLLAEGLLMKNSEPANKKKQNKNDYSLDIQPIRNI